MPKAKTRLRKNEKRPSKISAVGGVYHGKQAKTGNSLGLRFERALFHSHPEFNGEVRAHVIAPGRMLVVAHSERQGNPSGEDPVLSSFLSFLAADMAQAPDQIKSLDVGTMNRIAALVQKTHVDSDEDLGDEALI